MSGSPSNSFSPYKSSFTQSPSNSFSSQNSFIQFPCNSFSSPSSFGSQSSFQNLSSLNILLLHGNLDIWIYGAKGLPNMDLFHENMRKNVAKIFPGRLNHKIEEHVHRKITSDPYVTVKVSNATIGRTFVISNNENPVWMQHFYVPLAHYTSELRFVVKDNDVVGAQVIGSVSIPVDQIYAGLKVEGSFPIVDEKNQHCNYGAAFLSISVQYTPVDKLPIYNNGVTGTYFPLRKGGRITLYQDAHVHDHCLPVVKLGNGMCFEHGKCWHDISKAISGARRLIYITGWSVNHEVKLVRDAAGYTIGDLLKSKSQEGVRVLLLVWDDPTSQSLCGIQKQGKMNTGDEETRRFFKHSSVKILLCPRSSGKQHSFVKQQKDIIYSHHQKTVIVDADAGNNRRKIIAFVGGLDLCNGRYDTPMHSLFRTLQTVHRDDFYNPTFKGTVANCPREPWHDLHCKLDGPAAYDVLTNFEERWLKALEPSRLEKLKRRRSSYDDSLLDIYRVSDIIGISDSQCSSENDPETWHVQVFRSVDSNSVKGFPKDPKEATSKNLVCGKNALIDKSIHAAYINAIRAAQHFIYIENQYFLGSSYNWDSHKDLGANSLVPMEIALKIANKIKSNERFSAYIVIPMWPEGDPTGFLLQSILHWQHKTMQMMYGTVYKALEEAGLENTYTPQDYLNFFCLGNREALDGSGPSFVAPPLIGSTPQENSRRNRRFMIYVHSKGMIVDDEYVIIGSANINQRPMSGSRDTEIAMGAYQPWHTCKGIPSGPRGQVHGYRMSFWAEHIGGLEQCFTLPESLDCVRRVRQISEWNWSRYISEEIREMRGHLLKYPIEVGPMGRVRPLATCSTFPDVGGDVGGSFCGLQENLTI